jgi:hypothetical protein
LIDVSRNLPEYRMTVCYDGKNHWAKLRNLAICHSVIL